MENEFLNEQRLFKAIVAITDSLREYSVEQNVREDFSNATVRQLIVMKKVFTLQ